MGIMEMMGRGGAPPPEEPPPTPAAPVGPDEMLARLAAAGGSTEMVPAILEPNGKFYVDDSGNGLIGAPDANGMAARPVDANGGPWAPQFYGIGPPYNESPAPYTGGPPMNPGEAMNFSGGTPMPDNWQDFKGNTSSGGGFFTFADFFGNQGKQVPDGLLSGAGMASTNNYRLLPPDFRKPNFVMRNGQIIDLNSTTMWGPNGEPYSMDWYGGRWRNGSGAGVPAAYAAGPTAPNIVGWPGQLAPWGQSSTAS
jgi:hypothetical protein